MLGNHTGVALWEITQALHARKSHRHYMLGNTDNFSFDGNRRALKVKTQRLTAYEYHFKFTQLDAIIVSLHFVLSLNLWGNAVGKPS